MSRVWIGGALRNAAEATVSVADRGFTLGDGLFETLRVYDGVPFRLAAHLERLAAGARRIGIPFPDGLPDAVWATLAANGLRDAAVRVTLTRGAGERGLAPPASPLPTLVVVARPYQPEAGLYRNGISAVIASGRLNEHASTAGLKHLGYLPSVLALMEARAAGADDALLRNTAGHLAEATASNLFLVRSGVLHTPPLASGPLPGITRAAVLEVAERLGIRIDTAPLPPEALDGAEEVFLTGSLREIVPVVQVGAKRVGDGRPGPLTRRLLTAYRELARTERRARSAPA